MRSPPKSLARLAALGFAACGLAPATHAAAKPAAIPFITLGGVADAPNGYLEMCEREAALCTLGATRAPPPPLRLAPIAAMPPVDACATPSIDRPRLIAASFGLRFTDPFGAGRDTGFAPAANDCRVSRVQRPDVMTLPASFRAPIVAPQYIVQAAPPPPAPTAPPHRRAAPPTGFKLLNHVNLEVNRTVRQRTDMADYGVEELWTRPVLSGAGDCEDLALEKRVRLVEAGFDPDRLSYAVVYRRYVGLHVVLVARLDDGDVVLDSLSDKVRPWARTSYRWLRVQEYGRPGVWRDASTKWQSADTLVSEPHSG